MTYSAYRRDKVFEEHQVLTLGTGNRSWRMIECCIPRHYSPCEEICINGVLYYTATNSSSEIDIIVCFDVRSEKFGFVKAMKTFMSYGTLTNYNGKLGVFFSERSGFVCGMSRSIELWVLEDFEKQEWSEHVYVLPALWKTVVGRNSFSFVGLTRTNEIVLSMDYGTPQPFYIFYYNIERNTVVRVEIQGMEACTKVHTFLEHIENVKLTQSLRL